MSEERFADLEKRVTELESTVSSHTAHLSNVGQAMQRHGTILERIDGRMEKLAESYDGLVRALVTQGRGGG